MKAVLILSVLVASASAFVPNAAFVGKTSTSISGTVIVEGVEFDTISREWRCKWSADNDKKSLAEAQKVLSEMLPTIKGVDGVQGVQRVVCGGCLDFKVVTTLPAEKFGAWEATAFAPEEKFLEALKKVDGLTVFETQTYTNMPM